MSTSAHIMIEYRNSGETWKTTVTEGYLEANSHLLFDLMAPVGRNIAVCCVTDLIHKLPYEVVDTLVENIPTFDGAWSVRVRGLPEDCTKRTKERLTNVDYYGHSYLSYKELCKVASSFEQFPEWGFVNPITDKKVQALLKAYREAKSLEEQQVTGEAFRAKFTEQGLVIQRKDKHLRHLLRRMEALRRKYDEVRIVFCFDN